MTMGNDMSPLFSDVIACMQIPLLEIKKMVYLYLIHYSKSKPDLAALAINSFVRVRLHCFEHVVPLCELAALTPLLSGFLNNSGLDRL